MSSADLPPTSETSESAHPRGSRLEVFAVALRLGLTSFGGPVAHLGYFHAEYVRRRRWVDEETYSDLLALTNFLPGPASSQLGIAIGTIRAGLLGGILAWIGFTLPSAVLMILFAYGVGEFDVLDAGWLHGLKIAAVAVVANAVWGMSRTLAPDRERATLAIAAAVVMLVSARPELQVLVIVVGGVIGWRLLRLPEGQPIPGTYLPRVRGRRFAVTMLSIFLAILALSPILRGVFDSQWLNVFDGFYRAGSLIFGGGHVVLPLLQSEVVPPGWVSIDEFTAGYGAAQAVPGPIFLPSFFLVWGALPFWNQLRAIRGVQAAMRGIGAAVVGILLAALYDPVWTSAIFEPADVALALAAFGLLVAWRVPTWGIVLFCAAGGQVLAWA